VNACPDPLYAATSDHAASSARRRKLMIDAGFQFRIAVWAMAYPLEAEIRQRIA
jgi:hypothetical protein